MQAADGDARRPVIGERRQRGAVDGADAGHPVDAVLFLHVAEGVPAGEAGAQAQFHDFLGVEAGTGTAAEGFFPDGVRGHFHEFGADGAQDGAGLFEQAHGAGRVAGVVEGGDDAGVAFGAEIQLVVVNQVGRELGDVHHLGGPCVFKARAGDGGRGNVHHAFGSGAVVGRHVLVDDAPHVAAFAAEDPFGAEALGFRVHLGVQLLRHVEGHEGAEVAAFGGVGGQGVVQPKLVEQHQVPHEGVDAGFREHVAGRRDEEDLVPLLVERRIDMDTGDGFDIFAEEFNDFLEGVGLDAEVVARAVTVGHRFHDPVDAEAELMQQFADDSRDFGGIDAVGAEQRAAAAFGALVEVGEPFFDDVGGQLAGARNLAEETPGGGEVAAVHGTEQFRTQHRHIFRIVGAEEEVAFVGAGAATHAGIHEDLEGTVLGKTFLQGLIDDFFPVFGQVPILFLRLPRVGMRHVQPFHDIHLGGIGVHAGLDLGLDVHPALFGETRTGGDHFFRFWHFGH